ncbi:MAG: hypothetical protein A3F10_04920 [Coxiella sp. RIFCSPHIGHO2_12_FULL_42_15]|nr:MAG: hypothetical protein A3F10_04920 [Coxiella sp. RIFCSPHIGHO2_12_FULL_42_15]
MKGVATRESKERRVQDVHPLKTKDLFVGGRALHVAVIFKKQHEIFRLISREFWRFAVRLSRLRTQKAGIPHLPMIITY